jgi:hypothetical protein
MIRIAVFREFTELDALQRLVHPVLVDRAVKEMNSTSEIYSTNIKIFFNGNQDEAYRIKDVLEKNSFATFVTDQLTLTYPNGRIIQLPKDRIIMKLLK